MDGNDYPEEFVIAVKKDAFDNYYITRFMGHDTYLLNLSAFYVTPDEENGSIAYIECAQYMNQIKLADGTTYTYLVLLDGYGQNGKVQITHNDDDSFDIDYFDLATFGFADTEAAVVCYYLGATAVKITEDEANEFKTGIDGIKVAEHASDAVYNLAGQRIQSPVRGQIYIQNGKKFIAH